MATASAGRFSVWDYVVFALVLFLSVLIGLYHAFTGGKQKTTRQYLLANRGMMAIPVAISLLASFMSAITILGVPAEMYLFGTEYWMIIASYVILFPAVALVFVPVFRSIEITSSYEVCILWLFNCPNGHIHAQCFHVVTTFSAPGVRIDFLKRLS